MFATFNLTMSLLNKTSARKFIIDYAKATRGHPFNKVSNQFINEVEASLRNIITAKIHRHPSKGKTLMGD